MYSGIVEGLGKIIRIEMGNVMAFTISAAADLFEGLKLGDSIGVNGVCLTVVARTDNTILVHVVPETLQKTNLALVHEGAFVNLERPLKMDARNGGHNVQGHVDGLGTIVGIQDAGQGALLLEIETSENIAKYIVDKGFITIDGMSITVIEAMKNRFTVTLIPYTQAHSIAQFYQVGSQVNLEADIMGKYIEKYMAKFLARQINEH